VATSFCSRCGTPLVTGTPVCPSCGAPAGTEPGPPTGPDPTQLAWIIGGAAAVVLLVAAGLVWFLVRDGDDEEEAVVAVATTPSTATTTTTTAAPTTTTTTTTRPRPTTTLPPAPPTSAPPPPAPAVDEEYWPAVDPYEALLDWSTWMELNYQGLCEQLVSTADYGPDPWCAEVWDDRGGELVFRVALFPGGDFATWVLVQDMGDGWHVVGEAPDEGGGPPF
jgi:hypothetical protein